MTELASTSSTQARQSTLTQTKEVPFVTVALITFNKRSTVEHCLKSLFSLDYPNSRYEILAVDGGSIDGTLDVLRRFRVNTIIETKKNRGLARNIAVRHARGDIVAFIDADCLATRSWLKDHVSIHGDPRVLVVGGSVIRGGHDSLPARIYHETYFAGQSPTLPRRITWDLATCNASFKRSTFWQIGLFPEIDRGEDSLLCWDVLRKGSIVLYDPVPRVVHLHEQMNFRTLFRRTIEQGHADREIQQAFGKRSPFKLPRSLFTALLLGPSLVLLRFLRYFVELASSTQRQLSIPNIPILMGTSILWTLGYLTATRELGRKNA